MNRQIIVLLLLCSSLYVALSDNKVDYEDLNKAVFDAQNAARTNPSHYADLAKYEVENKFVYDRNNQPTSSMCLSENFTPKSNVCYNFLTTFEGVKAWKEAEAFLKSSSSNLKPLEWSEGLSQACYDHIRDIGPKGKTEHTGSDGSSSYDRITRYVTASTTGENLSFSDAVNGEDVVLQLLIDDGVSDRGHRKNIMDSGFTHAGVSCGCHFFYTEVCCIAYGSNVKENDSSLKATVAPQLNTCKTYTSLTRGNASGNYDLNKKYDLSKKVENTVKNDTSKDVSNSNQSKPQQQKKDSNSGRPQKQPKKQKPQEANFPKFNPGPTNPDSDTLFPGFFNSDNNGWGFGNNFDWEHIWNSEPHVHRAGTQQSSSDFEYWGEDSIERGIGNNYFWFADSD